MFKNYLKVVLRNLLRQKAYSFINISGLAIGMACAILVLLWVQDELSYDRFHENADRLYMVILGERNPGGDLRYYRTTPAPLAPELKARYPEITNSARFLLRRWGMGAGRQRFTEVGALVDPSFIDMFSIPFVKGDPKSALSNISNIVISEELAQKHFGDDDPIGKTIRIENWYDANVAGVVKNIPSNSHLRFDFLIPFQILQDSGWDLEDWQGNNYATYIILHKDIPVEPVRQKISHIIIEHAAESASLIDLHPITKIHLYALNGGGLISYVYIFSALALFVLLIACINFMNLTTARSTFRAKEIGIRKVIGAYKTNLVKQFLGESILFSFMALILALSLVELFLPEFNNLTDKQLSLDFSGNWLIYLGLCGITLFTGMVSGSYPALFLSSFQPAKVLGGTLISVAKASLLRRILVVAQFTLSIFLISGSLVVSGQLDYMRSKELGYDKENVLCMDMRGELHRHYQAFKNELLKNSRILSITRANTIPAYRESGAAGHEVSWEGKQTNDNFSGIKVMGVDTDYIKTFNMEMAEGRFFSESFPADRSEGFVINETAAKATGLASPVGKRFSLWDYDGKIIGVIKDFHFASLHYEIEPLVMKMGWALDNICMRIKPDDIPNTIRFIEDKLKEIIPDYPFEYEFLDESLNRRYRAEQRMETLSKYMTVLAIFVSCLGLFGLAAFTAERRTKEISIRKVFGASASALVFLLSKEYIKWIIAANVIAWPVARVVINSWLQNFAYRIDVDILPFLKAGALALVIALLTVSFQAIKAAIANPVEALRYE